MSDPAPLPPPRRLGIDELLQRAASWVADRTPVAEDTREALAAVVETNAVKLGMFTQVLALKKAQRLRTLVEMMDRVEARIMDPAMLEEASLKTLVQVGTLLLHTSKEESEFILATLDRQTSRAGVVSVLEEDSVVVGEERVKSIAPDRREAIRGLFERLTASVKNATNGR